jgi:hypothetical protein
VCEQLVVPAYTALAAQIKSHQDAQREEHNVLKQKVLQVGGLPSLRWLLALRRDRRPRCTI